MLCTSLTSMAYDFVVDGIYYQKVYDWATQSYREVNVAPQFEGSSSNAAAYSGEVVIPSSVEYDGVVYNVKGVSFYAFAYCASVTKIILPESVKNINGRAFYGCDALKSIEMPGVTEFGGEVFYNCTSLVSVTITEGTTSLSEYMFDRCYNLTEVHLPTSLISIGYRAFFGCHSLTSIDIPENVSSIETEAFSDCM